MPPTMQKSLNAKYKTAPRNESEKLPNCNANIAEILVICMNQYTANIRIVVIALANNFNCGDRINQYTTSLVPIAVIALANTPSMFPIVANAISNIPKSKVPTKYQHEVAVRIRPC